MTDNLPAQFQPGVLAAHMEYAKALAVSDLLPRQYQGKPANLLWAISYGQTLGVDPMVAVQSIHVISGKPTASADLIAGLVRRAGHKLRVTGDDHRAEAVIIRADDPGFEFRAVWTIERAQAAKLTGKDTWKQFPAAMLKARAVTEVARAACSEILQGTIYTPEEMGAVVDAEGNPVDGPQRPMQVVDAEVVADTAGRFDAAAEGDVSGGRDWIAEANAAPSAAAVRALYVEAGASGTAAHLAVQIAEIGKQKAAAEQDEPIEAEVLDEHAAAVEELRKTAADKGMADHVDADFEGTYGTPIPEGTVANLREMAGLIRNAA